MSGIQHSTVPRTAMADRSRSKSDQLAKGLGWFSIGLGLFELFAAEKLCDALGLEGHETLVRGYGAREVATGMAILASHDPTPWIWGRVAGDALDLATLAAAGSSARGDQQGNVALAVAAVAGVTALDVYCARALEAEKGSRSTAITDYSDRSGFPREARAMRGAAGDFEVPRDMRVPDLLRADQFQARSVRR